MDEVSQYSLAREIKSIADDFSVASCRFLDSSHIWRESKEDVYDVALTVDGLACEEYFGVDSVGCQVNRMWR